MIVSATSKAPALDVRTRITAILTAYKRPEQTLETLRKLMSCDPAPDEIIVHVDGGEKSCLDAVHTAFPNVALILSDDNIGPGGGRNKLIEASRNEIVASFDDDSYPIDLDFFARAEIVMRSLPQGVAVGCAVFHRGEPTDIDRAVAVPAASFIGCGVVLRKQSFLAAGGYVPLPIAYSMEEEDLALRMLERDCELFQSPWLRVRHDTDLGHHNDPLVTAGTISNLALLTWLRYPLRYWPYGVLQVINRIAWSLKSGRARGIASGIANIPRHIWRHRSMRKPVSTRAMWRRHALRTGAGEHEIKLVLN